MQRPVPFEDRDQLDEAEAWYNDPLRTRNRQLEDENVQLKRLLRENGISWSPSLIFDGPRHGVKRPSSTKGRLTRSSVSKVVLQQVGRMPTLPIEIQLKVMELALTSDYPILDPLSKRIRDNMTLEESVRSNQIAIGFLATCKAYHVEGTQFLWKNNHFVFTSHHTLRNFANIGVQHRQNIKSITLRIIGKYYDDSKRSRTMRSNVPGKKTVIKAAPRVNENPLSRKGYKSYTWLQIVDFLDALRPPFDPSSLKKKQPRPRLFPQLESMRIDFVHFPANYLSQPELDIHRLAVHDLGCSLNELILTGLPSEERGMRVLNDLTGMVRDDGMVLKSTDTYIGDNAGLLRTPDCTIDARVVRAWKAVAKDLEEELELLHEADGFDDFPSHHRVLHHNAANVPAVPQEPGHPESTWARKKTIWKRVPSTRDSQKRDWVEFSRTWGTRVSPDDEDVDDSDVLICDGCGEVHEPLSDYDF